MLPLLAAYIGLSCASIGEPFQDEETWEYYASRSLLEEGVARQVTGEPNNYHPHGYYFLGALAMGLFGPSEPAIRLVGVLATIGTFLVMLRILARVQGTADPRARVLLGIFYLLSPAVIQGALVITADTAVHHLFVTIFLLAALDADLARGRRCALLAVLVAGMMWIKVATPCVIVLALALAHLLRRDWPSVFRAMVLVGGGGLALFLLTWTLYCSLAAQDHATVLSYLAMQVGARGHIGSVAGKLLQIGRWVLILVVWLGVPYAALALRSAVALRRQIETPLGMLLVVGVVLALFHLFISGIPYSYPRYHFTMLPIWALLAAVYASSALAEARFRPAPAAAFVGAAAIYFSVVAGDPMRLVLHDLKAAVLACEGISAPSVAAIGVRLACLVAPALVLFVTSLRAPWRAWSTAGLAGLAIAANVALCAHQACADYTTGAAYGETGTERVAAEVRARLAPGDSILAGKDLVYHAGANSYIHDWEWADPTSIGERIRSPRTRFVVLGLHHNTIEQIRAMFDAELHRRPLEQDYDHRVIGSYLVWERRSLVSPASGRGRIAP